MDLRYPQSQKSQGFKSGDLGSQAVGNCRLIILLSPKWWWSSCFMQRAICGGAPSCIKNVVLLHCLALRTRITDSFNNEAYRWLVMVHLSLLIVWNKCTTAISVTTESSACNFLQFDLLGLPICILAAIACKDTASWLLAVRITPGQHKMKNFCVCGEQYNFLLNRRNFLALV